MRFLVLAILLTVFLASCGEENPLEDSEVSDKAPSVSIEKVGEKELEYQIELEFRVVSDSKPKTDLLVRVIGPRSGCDTDGDFGNKFYPYWYFDSYDIWVIIPKGETKSQTTTFRAGFDESRSVQILPLPLIDIVGEGMVIDQEELQDEYGGGSTVEGKRIPEDFVFAYYEVADSESMFLFIPKPAKIISVDPPSGSILSGRFGSDVKITFDNPPQCPRLINVVSDRFPPTIISLYDGNRANVHLSSSSKFTIVTGSEELGNEVVSEQFNYQVLR